MECVKVGLEVVKHGCLCVERPFKIVDDSLVIEAVQHLTLFAGSTSGLTGLSVSSLQTRLGRQRGQLLPVGESPRQ